MPLLLPTCVTQKLLVLSYLLAISKLSSYKLKIYNHRQDIEVTQKSNRILPSLPYILLLWSLCGGSSPASLAHACCEGEPSVGTTRNDQQHPRSFLLPLPPPYFQDSDTM